MSSSALQKMLSSAISHLHNDVRFVGAGYYEELRGKELQDNSFFKIALIYESAQMDSVLSDSEHIISTLDHLVTAFSDESAPGTARWTCLFENPLLLATFTFLCTDSFRSRSENPTIFWERNGKLTRIIEEQKPNKMNTELQWVEDRFWVWLLYAAQRLYSGELFEVISTIDLIRKKALGPMYSIRAHQKPAGLRYLEEIINPFEQKELQETLAKHDLASCEIALKAIAKTYVGLRETLDRGDLRRNRRAELGSLSYLHDICQNRH